MTISRNLSILAEGVSSSGVLGAANGGTGLASPGTSGNVLTSNGTGWASTAPVASGGFSNIQVFTSTTTFTVPAGVTKVKVTVVGGGGAGGYDTSYSASGGGGGGAAIKIVTGLTPGGTVAVTVGTTVSGRTTSGTGAAGNTSSFGAYCSATGGSGGINNSSAPGGNNVVSGVAGGLGSSGDLNIKGGGSQAGASFQIPYGTCTYAVFNFCSGGGSSIMGGGTQGVSTSLAGIAGSVYGGGGGGSSSGGSSGAGATGVVIVEY